MSDPRPSEPFTPLPITPSARRHPAPTLSSRQTSSKLHFELAAAALQEGGSGANSNSSGAASLLAPLQEDDYSLQLDASGRQAAEGEQGTTRP